jgi:hypothetical protein
MRDGSDQRADRGEQLAIVRAVQRQTGRKHDDSQFLLDRVCPRKSSIVASRSAHRIARVEVAGRA